MKLHFRPTKARKQAEIAVNMKAEHEAVLQAEEARTQAEIQENMDKVVEPTSAGLWAYYKLDEGESETNNTLLSNTIIDSGPNGFDATLLFSAKNGSLSNWVEGTIVTEALGDGIGSAIVTEDGITYDGWWIVRTIYNWTRN